MASQMLTLNTTTKLYEPGIGVGKSALQFVYDFSVLGGAQGSIPLTALNGALPSGFVVQNALLDIITPLTSGGLATAAVTTGQGAGDLVAATLISGVPFSSTGLKVTAVLMGTIATLIKATAQRSPAIVVAVADLTAGKFNQTSEKSAPFKAG